MNGPAQGSAEWHQARCGKITASRFADAISGTKAARDRYAHQLVFERTSGAPLHEVTSKSMAWGSKHEHIAREEFEVKTGLIVEPSVFLLHAAYPFIGSSPDGLVGGDAGIEMKCPYSEEVHIKTMLEGMPKDHKAQVQGNMAVTGRSHWWFISYDPRQAEQFRLYFQRISRDDNYIANMIAELCEFDEYVNKLIVTMSKKLLAQQS